MTTAINTVYRTADSLLSTEMDALAAGSLTAVGTELDNTTDRDLYCVFDLELASLDTSGETSPGVAIYAVEVTDDGVTYPPTVEAGNYVLTIPFDAGSGAETKTVSAYGTMYLNPGKYKFFLKNEMATAALAATGNTLKCRRFTPESA